MKNGCPENAGCCTLRLWVTSCNESLTAKSAAVVRQPQICPGRTEVAGVTIKRRGRDLREELLFLKMYLFTALKAFVVQVRIYLLGMV